MANWYHLYVAGPDSQQHQANMLQGYPGWHLLKYIIDPNQAEDDADDVGL